MRLSDEQRTHMERQLVVEERKAAYALNGRMRELFYGRVAAYQILLDLDDIERNK